LSIEGKFSGAIQVSSSNNRSGLVDGIVRPEQGKLVIDQGRLEGILNRYGTEQRPILDDRDVMRVLAQRELARSETLVNEARLQRYADMRALGNIEETGVKFPLTRSDRFIGLIKDKHFRELMAKTITKREESSGLDKTLNTILSYENYYRNQSDSRGMPKDTLFSRLEKERTASNIIEIGHAKMWVEINGLGTNFVGAEEQGRREAASRLGLVRHQYERNILDTFSQSFENADKTMSVGLGMDIGTLQRNLSIRAYNANGFRNAADRIANLDINRQIGPNFTPAEMGLIAEYAQVAEGDRAQTQIIQGSYSRARIPGDEPFSKSSSPRGEAYRSERPEPHEISVLAR